MREASSAVPNRASAPGSVTVIGSQILPISSVASGSDPLTESMFSTMRVVLRYVNFSPTRRFEAGPYSSPAVNSSVRGALTPS